MAKRKTLPKKRRAFHHQKGQAFERAMCRRLSLWLSGGTNKNLLWRSSGSGARATQLRKTGTNLSVHAGDIAAIDPAGMAFCEVFFIECKWYKTLQLQRLFYGVQHGLGLMWDKCKNQARSYRKVPMLICHENGKPELVCLPTWLVITPSLCLATFPTHKLSVFRLADLERLAPTTFISEGQDDARITYSRPSFD